MGYDDRVEITELLGKTLTDIKATDEDILFTTDSGQKYLLYHDQD